MMEMLAGRLIAGTCLLQALELLQIRSAWADQGVWSWSVLKKEWPLPLGEKNFATLLTFQVVVAVGTLIEPNFLGFAVLWVITVLSAWRFRGSFNGGSDAMTVAVLSGLLVMAFFPRAGMWYLAVQVTLSYFVAGAAKLRHRSWREGQALPDLLCRSNYGVPSVMQSAVRRPGISKFLSWGVLIFECSFPLALVDPRLCLLYVTAALVFHLGNFYVLGLNRFVFSWLSAYPILYLASQTLQGLAP